MTTARCSSGPTSTPLTGAWRQRWALVKTPENTLYRVRNGSYMGQNFGVVAMITDTTVTLKELIQDTNGSWSERTSALQLVEEGEKK